METPYPRLSQALVTSESGHLLVEHLQEKQRLLTAHDPAHKAIKTVAIFGGGGMRGVYGSGVIDGLEQLGMNAVFDDLIGISAGACNAAYLAAHQAAVGPSVFYDVLPNNGFIKKRHPRNLMDMDLLADVFRNRKALDQTALRGSRSHLYIGMTDVETGTAKYLGLRDMPEDFDVVNALIASSSIPGVTEAVRAIEGKRYSDGLSSCTDPLTYAVDVLGATDILVVMNSPLGATTKLTVLEKTINKIILRGFSPAFKQAHESRHVTNGLFADREYNPNITVGVLCPSENLVSRASSNSRMLKKVADLATVQTISIFGK
jgi:predicted patatin/cPLA2 family phospholipase